MGAKQPLHICLETRTQVSLVAGSFKVAAIAKTLNTKHSRQTAFKNVRITRESASHGKNSKRCVSLNSSQHCLTVRHPISGTRIFLAQRFQNPRRMKDAITAVYDGHPRWSSPSIRGHHRNNPDSRQGTWWWSLPGVAPREGTFANIPSKASLKSKPYFNTWFYQNRNLIERFFSKPKHFGTLATR